MTFDIEFLGEDAMSVPVIVSEGSDSSTAPFQVSAGDGGAQADFSYIATQTLSKAGSSTPAPVLSGVSEILLEESAEVNQVVHGKAFSPLLPPDKLTIERIFSSPSLNGSSLQSVKFSPDGSRVTYLKGKAEKGDQLDLWECTLSDGRHRMLVDSDLLSGFEKELSLEEEAHREALRLFGSGIVDYHWFPDGKALLFPIGNSLFHCDLHELKAPLLRPLIEEEKSLLDVKISPKGSYISFVQEKNIYVVDAATGAKIAVTTDGCGSVKNGMAEFVAQEEMERYTGYWWSDDESRIAYTQTDETPVVLEVRHEKRGYTEEPYPFAGTPNVLWKLGVVQLERPGETCWLELPRESEDYLLRASWEPASTKLSVQLISRDQKLLRLLSVDCDRGEITPILEEGDAHWINAHDDYHPLKDRSGFIWSSEQTGYRHLYLHASDGTLSQPITGGEWVVKKVIGVDEANKHVYFEGFKDSVLEQHIYTVQYDKEKVYPVRKISAEAGWHSAILSPEKDMLFHSYESYEVPPQTRLTSIRGEKIAVLHENRLELGHPYFPYASNHPDRVTGTLSTEEGIDLHYSLMKPKDFDPAKQYPVIVYVYGGPCTRLVKNCWERTHWKQFMVDRGYLVFTLDNRGSSDRGKAFEAALSRNMGNIEVDDQTLGVRYLQSLPYVATEKIGLFGWSYGGYMTLKMMSKRAEDFPVGVSVAPVTDWNFYDTFYTERYMGLPEENPEGYRESSVASGIDKLSGNLLLVHGLSDNNVFSKNSLELVETMQEKDIPFEMMAYPSQRHSISSRRSHLFKQVTRFLDRNLLMG
jgi:dipeptidyl-peptidase-4